MLLKQHYAVLLLCTSLYANLLCAQKDAAFLIGVHPTVNCQEEIPLVPPVSASTAAQDLRFQDQYFPIGCNHSGFQGYFAWDRWSYSTAKYGDAGVDVTGAPNSVLVEGANRASIILPPHSGAAYELAIPAEGFVQLDWGYVGGSSFSTSASFQILVNGSPVDMLREERDGGRYFSAVLDAGDLLRFEAQSGAHGFEIRLGNFEFYSNAIGVIAREWQGHQAYFTQLISIEKPDFSQIIFPPHYDGFHAPVIDHPDFASPEVAGYPVIDKDGLLDTTYDQLALKGESCSYQSSWEDELLYENGLCIIFRKWTVRDLCGQNISEATQLLRVRGGCPTEGLYLPPAQQADSPALPNEGAEPCIVMPGNRFTL